MKETPPSCPPPRATQPIVPLSEAHAGFGGKASGLARLTSLALPVPKGFALSPELVSRIVGGGQVAHPHTEEMLQEHLSTRLKNSRLAVRSSALHEDGAEHSFAGIFDTVLNVPSELSHVLKAIREVGSSQGSQRLSAYEEVQKIESSAAPQLGIVVQEMIDAEIAGVAFFTLAPGSSDGGD